MVDVEKVDVEKVAQVRAMAKAAAASFTAATNGGLLPPTVHAPFAAHMYAQGFRFHPELATVQAVPEGTEAERKRLGNWAPMRLESVTETLKQVVAHTNPALAARIENAKTEAQKAELASEVYGENRAVIDKATQQLADASPEDLE